MAGAGTVLGPPRRGIYERSAIAPASPPASLVIFAARAPKMFRWWVRGLAWPTPFFDERTKAALTERGDRSGTC
jgi:hypothetical protein